MYPLRLALHKTLILLASLIVACSGNEESSDVSPDTIQFKPVINATPNAQVESETITVAGVDRPVSIAVEGGEYRIGDGAYTDSPGFVESGQTVTLRLVTSRQLSQESAARLMVGDASTEFVVETRTSFANAAPVWNLNESVANKNTITGSARGANTVQAIDFDSDGDTDVLATAAFDDAILWFENDGGTAPLFTRHLITDNAEGVISTLLADLDGDGDQDIVAALVRDNTLVWYENDAASLPSFSAHIITDQASELRAIFVADLDGDNQLDVLAASQKLQGVAWYQNQGNGRFIERPITAIQKPSISIFSIDIDGDSDLDIIASHSDDTVAWYENTGSANGFIEHALPSSINSVFSLYAADIDNDGDADILSASLFGDAIAWYENDGGSSPQFSEHFISTLVEGANSLSVVDLDADGDLDVLTASIFDSTIAWYENDGGDFPSFSERVVTNFAAGAQAVIAADIDLDEDLDLLAASQIDSTIAWYSTTQRRYSVEEGKTLSIQELAMDSDDNVLTYSIYGIDADHFKIDSASGLLTFADPPATATPEDFNLDNVYEVWLSVNDGFAVQNLSIAVSVSGGSN